MQQDNPQSILTGLLKSFMHEGMKDVGTSIPGHILTFDPFHQTAQLQIGIVRTDSDDKTYTPPPLIECPVVFSGGGGFAVEHELNPGDPGWIIFSQRCIDGWMQTGGVAQNPVLRFHDVADAMFIPGVRPNPKAMSGFVNDGIRLRNADASSYVWLRSTGVFIKTAGAFDIQSGTMTHNGVNVGSTHTHAQDNDSGGNTERNTKVPQ